MANNTVASGVNGKITDGTDQIADITSWALARAAQVATYQSSKAAGWRRAKAGGRQWEATFDFKAEADGNFHVREGMYLTDVEFHLDATENNYYKGSGIVQDVSDTVDVDTGEVIGGSCTIIGDGAYTTFGTAVVSELLSSS